MHAMNFVTTEAKRLSIGRLHQPNADSYEVAHISVLNSTAERLRLSHFCVHSRIDPWAALLETLGVKDPCRDGPRAPKTRRNQRP